MIIWVTRWSIISLILILLIHYLVSFLIDTLTFPKTKDMVHKPAERYNEIISNISVNPKNTKIDVPEQPNETEMQDELRTFLSNIRKESGKTHPSPNIVNNDYTSY